MSKTSADSLEAMRDADKHAAGLKHTDNVEPTKVHGHEHTKPAGDLRQVELREDGQQVQRRDYARGEK